MSEKKEDPIGISRLMDAFTKAIAKNIEDTSSEIIRLTKEQDAAFLDSVRREGIRKAGLPSNFDELRRDFNSALREAVGEKLANEVGLESEFHRTSEHPVFVGKFTVNDRDYFILRQIPHWRVVCNAADYVPTLWLSDDKLRNEISIICHGAKPEEPFGFVR